MARNGAKTNGLMALAALLTLAACEKQPAADAATNNASNEVVAVEPDAPPPGGADNGAPPSMGDPSKNPDMTGFAAEVDANGDGQLSTAEWKAKGLPESSFKMFEKGRGYVTLKDYQTNAAPPGIDMNGDGKVTVAEFKEFDKTMSAKMAGGPKTDAPK